MSLQRRQRLPLRTCPPGAVRGQVQGLLGGGGQGPDCACRPTALTFREEQCAAYNHRPDLFKSFPGPMDWVPRYAGVAARDQCKLTCQARALGYYYVLEPRVSRAARPCLCPLPPPSAF